MGLGRKRIRSNLPRSGHDRWCGRCHGPYWFSGFFLHCDWPDWPDWFGGICRLSWANWAGRPDWAYWAYRVYRPDWIGFYCYWSNRTDWIYWSNRTGGIDWANGWWWAHRSCVLCDWS